MDLSGIYNWFNQAINPQFSNGSGGSFSGGGGGASGGGGGGASGTQYSTQNLQPALDPNRFFTNTGTQIKAGPVPTGTTSTPTQAPPQPSGPSAQDLYNQRLQQLQSQIETNANDMLAGLTPQKTAQEGIVNNNYTQGITDVNASRDQGLLDLGAQERQNEQNKTKTLGDLASNLQNMFQAGNVYLGARGAADSSAADQYSYALQRIGNQNRGNVLSQATEIQNQINDRKTKLQNIVTQETSRLTTEKNNQLLQVAQWYADAQNQIKSTKGQNLVALGEQALNQALNYLNQVNQDYQNKQTALQTWALNNAKTWDQALQAVGAQASFKTPGLVSAPLNGMPNYGAPSNSGAYYAGANSNDEYDMSGNKLR